MNITVVISTWCVPFDQVVVSVTQFGGDTAPEAARRFINEQSAKWWDEFDGDRAVLECAAEPYEPISELGYNHARYEMWGGEMGFHAMIDAASFMTLHEAHYQREYDENRLQRPGYLINAYLGNPAHNLSPEDRAKYEKQQAEGFQKLGEVANRVVDKLKH